MRAHIFDPNDTNPYGVELARVLRSNDWVVTIDSANESAGSQSKRLVGSVPKRMRAVPGYIARRLLQPLNTAIVLLCAKPDIVILVWIKDSWQAVVFGFVARFIRVHWINHNPVGLRAQDRMSWPEAWLAKSSAGRPVHGRELASFDEPIVIHPSYNGIVGSCASARAPSILSNVDTESSLLVFIGALRPDKGSEALVDIVSRLDFGFTLVLVGGEVVPCPLQNLVESMDDSVVFATPRVSDCDLVETLRLANVVVAPYSSPTQSGSLILALTVGCPAVAFEGGALSTILPGRRLLPRGDIDGFATEVTTVASGGSETRDWKVSANELDDACFSSWSAVAERHWTPWRVRVGR